MYKNWDRYWQQSLRKQRNFVALCALALFLSNICLSLLFFKRNERVMVVPAGFSQAVWQDDKHFSSSYLEEMGMFFISLAFDVTPASIDFKQQSLLKYIASDSFHSLQAVLLKDAARIKSKDLSSSFAVSKVHASPLIPALKLEGVLSLRQDGVEISQKQKEVFMRFGREGGRIVIKELDSHDIE
jgi:type IV conjugative transfer system protein TraE